MKQIGRNPDFAIDVDGIACLNTVFMLTRKRDDIDPFALLAFLNSRLIAVLWLDRYYDRRATFPKIKGTYLKKLPCPKVDQQSWRRASDRLAELARRQIHLYGLALKTVSPFERKHAEIEMEQNDRAIDTLVVDLCELDAEAAAAIRDYRMPDEAPEVIAVWHEVGNIRASNRAKL